jgi:hypothetical protein
MSEYIMDPGARLEIGPGGKPYEELGACCAACVTKGSALGAIIVGGGFSTPPIIAPPIVPPSGGAAPVTPPAATSSLPLILGLGAVGVVGFLVVRRLRRKKR